jgi:ribonuclease-3
MCSTSPSIDPEVAVSCEEVLGYTFKDPQHLDNALTHASGADHRLESNERLEFLGDAILGLVVCERLFHRFPDFLEGELTRIKSIVVSRRTCATISRHLGMDRFLRLGKGLTVQMTVPSSVMADVFESLVAAIYLDGGLEPAREFIQRHVDGAISELADGSHGGNFKSHLQQVAQKRFARTPTYEMLDEKGPDHSKCFKMSAVIGDQRFAAAWGRNKKEAEQRAALNALDELEGRPASFSGD